MNNMNKRCVGLIPAAGKNARFDWIIPKELFPVGSERRGDRLQPKPLSRYVFDAMKLAGVDIFYFVVHPSKTLIMEYYGNGSRFDTQICYLVQEERLGLGHAIEQVKGFVKQGDDVLFGMPDTIIQPETGFLELYDFYKKNHLDIAVGAFRVRDPQNFGTVILDENASFHFCEDKPSQPKSQWIWGILIFNEKYLEVSETLCKPCQREFQVADVLNAAKLAGLRIAAFRFTRGTYLDFPNYEAIHEIPSSQR